MRDKSKFDNYNSGLNLALEQITRRSDEIDEILKLPSRDLRLYIQAIWEEQNRDKSLVKELKKAKNKVEKENERLKEQNVDLQVELKRIEALEDASKKTDEENQNLKKQNASLQVKKETERVKRAVFSETNRVLRRQLEKFYDLSTWLSIGFIAADIFIDSVSTDFANLSGFQRGLFGVGLLLRIFGVAAIWVCIRWTKLSFRNSERRVDLNQNADVSEQIENLS